MLVAPAGGRLWRFRYRYRGKEKLLALGRYPDVPLRRAREKRDEARSLVANGIDPTVQRQTDKAALGVTFELVAREWLKRLEKSVKASTFERERSQLKRFVFPDLHRPSLIEGTLIDYLFLLRHELGVHDDAFEHRGSLHGLVEVGVSGSAAGA
jgi:hypothetical protein